MKTGEKWEEGKRGRTPKTFTLFAFYPFTPVLLTFYPFDLLPFYPF
jgi:hypothetical protein